MMNLLLSLLLIVAQGGPPPCNCPAPVMPPTQVECGTCPTTETYLDASCYMKCLDDYRNAVLAACSQCCQKKAYAWGVFDATMNGLTERYNACIASGQSPAICQATVDALAAAATATLTAALAAADAQLQADYAAASAKFTACELACCKLCNPHY